MKFWAPSHLAGPQRLYIRGAKFSVGALGHGTCSPPLLPGTQSAGALPDWKQYEHQAWAQACPDRTGRILLVFGHARGSGDGSGRVDISLL